MSVEEQIDRMRRHQSGSMKEKRRSLQLPASPAPDPSPRPAYKVVTSSQPPTGVAWHLLALPTPRVARLGQRVGGRLGFREEVDWGGPKLGIWENWACFSLLNRREPETSFSFFVLK